MKKLRVLDLFSGIGGFSLGLERTGGFETVAFCEIEEYPRKVLAKHWPDVPCYRDVRELTAKQTGAVDVVCGGYPCQPFSTAGKRRGTEDDRHLWPEFSRLVAELRPTWVIGENVAGHISMGLDDVLSDLEGQGYTARTFVIPACALGAHHRRDRCWTIAHSGDVLQSGELDARADSGAPGRSEGADERGRQASHRQRVRSELGAGTQDVADTHGSERWAQHPARFENQGQSHTDGLSRRKKISGGPRRDDEALSDTERIGRNEMVAPITGRTTGERPASPPQYSSFARGWEGWLTEPNVGRVVNGVPSRVDRLKCLGNAVVPQIPEMIGYTILEAEGV